MQCVHNTLLNIIYNKFDLTYEKLEVEFSDKTSQDI